MNHEPVADAQDVSTDEDEALPITLTGTDVDGDNLTFSIVDAPTHGVLKGAGANLTYSPAKDFNGEDHFTFRTSDGELDSAAATVSITLQSVNDAPVAESQSLSTPEDTNKTITLAGTDVDDQELSFTVVDQPEHGLLTGDGANLTYTPTQDYHGSDRIAFRASDGTSQSKIATVEITITAVNDAPVAAPQALTTDEDTAIDVALAGSDVEESELTFWVLSQPERGGLTGTLPNLVYLPAKDFNGEDSFTFDVSDGELHSVTSTIAITVEPVNDQPIAIGRDVTTDEDTAAIISLAGDDVEASMLTFVVVEQPQHGTLNGDLPNVTYRPADDYHGPDQFTFKVNDGELDSEVATFAITVTAVNDSPKAESQSLTTGEDVTLDIVLAGSDVDEQPLTFLLSKLPEHGTLSGEIPNLIYKPDTNFFGEDEFAFTVSDGAATSDPATISVTVRPLNDPPSVNDLENVTDEDTPINIPLPFDDVDGDALIIKVLSVETLGNVEIIDDGGPTLTYDPTASPAIQAMVQRDSLEESIVLSVSDGNGTVETATVTVTVSGKTDWQNPVDRLDSNGDKEVSPIDALVIINSLNEDGSRELGNLLEPPPLWYDVNGDGSISPIDPLVIINHLNETESEGEGHFIVAPISHGSTLLPPNQGRSEETRQRWRTDVYGAVTATSVPYHEGSSRPKLAHIEALDQFFADLAD